MLLLILQHDIIHGSFILISSQYEAQNSLVFEHFQ